MVNNKRWVTGLVLALSGTLLWTNLSWAQGRGGGGRGSSCPVNQTSQNIWQGQGQGQGNPNCPNYPGYRGRGQGRGMNSQGFQGPMGPQGRGPNTQTNNPNINQ